MRLEVDGLGPLINRFEKFHKDIGPTLKKEMRGGAAIVQKAAQSTVSGFPISGWGNWNSGGRDLSYDPAAVRRGFKVATNRYRRRGVTTAFGYDVVQSNAGGSVFEVIGDKSRVTDERGAQFVDSVVGSRGGKKPRTLIPAYYAGITQARERIESALKSAMRKVGL